MVIQTLTTVSTDSLTTEASLDSSNTLTSSQRVDGVTIKTITGMDTTATLSRTSTEDNLQTGLMGSTLRQRIRRCMVITMIKCQLVLRTRSTDQVTLSQTESHSSQPSTRHLLMTSLLRLSLNPLTRKIRKAQRTTKRVIKTNLKRNKTKCW